MQKLATVWPAGCFLLRGLLFFAVFSWRLSSRSASFAHLFVHPLLKSLKSSMFSCASSPLSLQFPDGGLRTHDKRAVKADTRLFFFHDQFTPDACDATGREHSARSLLCCLFFLAWNLRRQRKFYGGLFALHFSPSPSRCLWRISPNRATPPSLHHPNPAPRSVPSAFAAQ